MSPHEGDDYGHSAEQEKRERSPDRAGGRDVSDAREAGQDEDRLISALEEYIERRFGIERRYFSNWDLQGEGIELARQRLADRLAALKAVASRAVPDPAHPNTP